MEKLQNLEYNNFIELLGYLESLSKSDIPEEKEIFVEEKIQSFFPELDAIQELELSYIVKQRDEKAFNLFKESYPDLLIDPTGQSTPESKDYWELTEKSLESIYEFALRDLESSAFNDKSYNKVNTQVYNARNLSCLINMEPTKYDAYAMYRKLFFDSSQDFSRQEYKEAEIQLKELNLNYSAFLITVLKYAFKRKEDISVFMDHLFRRIEVLHSDKDLKSSINKVFLSNINSIIDKNNKLYEQQ